MKNSKIFFINIIFLFLIIFSLNSCVYSNGGLGNEVEEVREIGNFDGIKVSSGIDIKLIQGSSTKLVIRADEDIIDDIKAEVRGGVLELSVDRNWFRRGHIEADITFVDISVLDVSAGSDVESTGRLTFEEIEIEASSGSDLRMELEAREVKLRASSGSDANLRGTSRQFSARASSGSDINAEEFEVENAVLELSSGSDVKVWVTGSLDVDASSGSDVYYRGEPEVVNINTSGGSDVHRR